MVLDVFEDGFPFGFRENFIFFSGGSCSIFSPKFVASAVPPRIKKAVSILISAAISRSWAVVSSRFQSWFRAFRRAAAFEESPPRPDESGIFWLVSFTSMEGCLVRVCGNFLRRTSRVFFVR